MPRTWSAAGENVVERRLAQWQWYFVTLLFWNILFCFELKWNLETGRDQSSVSCDVIFPAKETFKSKKNYDLLEHKVLPSRTSWKVWAQKPGIKNSKIVPRIHRRPKCPSWKRGYLFQASSIWKGTYFTWWWSAWKGREICHFWSVKKAQSSG